MPSHHLNELLDESAIRSLIWSFSDAVNRCDEAAFAALWAPDAHWFADPPFNLDAKGLSAITGLFQSLLGQWSFFYQSSNCGPVTISDNRASAVTNIEEVGVTQQGQTSRFLGRYDDIVIRTEAGWKFTRRHCRIHFFDTLDRSPEFLLMPETGVT